MDVVPLGGGGYAGKACTLVRIGPHSVLFDCGLHPVRHCGEDSVDVLDAPLSAAAALLFSYASILSFSHSLILSFSHSLILS